jgi:abequosyltransferase
VNLLLSICIPTINRGKFLPETLNSILNQITDDVEIVLVDGGSKDNTAEIARAFCSEHPCIRYILSPYAGDTSLPSNAGFDRDCDHAVRSARGEYCWLMTDDDILVPNALATIREKIENDFDVIITATKVKDIRLDKTLLAKRTSVDDDKVFMVNQFNEFFSCAANAMTFVGCIILRRKIWIEQNTSRYFGSGFIHIAAIFNCVLANPTLVLSTPLVIIRYSNALWTQRAFQIMMISWPQLVWALPAIDAKSKASVVHREPWRKIKPLIRLRALGAYDNSVYKTHLQSKSMPVLLRTMIYGVAIVPRPLTRILTKIVALKRSVMNGDQLLLQDLIDSGK